MLSHVVVLSLSVAMSATCACRSSSNTIITVLATPVVYTNNAGGGEDELQVPPNGSASKLFDAGRQVMAAWYTPYDNIGDLTAISQIDVLPAGNSAKLLVHGVPNQRNARVRIKIYVQLQ